MRHAYPAPPARVREVLADEQYLRDKLAAVGGPGAELVSHGVTDGRTTVVQRQAVAAENLPSLVRTFVPGDLHIERTETWTGATAGAIDVSVAGAPGSVGGTISVDPDGAGSVVVVRMEATMPVPLVGGKIEKAITENIARLGDVEHRFTVDWLRRHPAA